MPESFILRLRVQPADVRYLCPDIDEAEAAGLLTYLESEEIDGGAGDGLAMLRELLICEGYEIDPAYNEEHT